MTKEQAIEILEGLKKSNEACIKSSKIEDTPFTTIWKRQNKSIETVLTILEEKDKTISSKDKIIDLTAEYISNITDCPFESEGKYLDCEKMCDVRTDKECWKQYFENKAKERR